MSAADNTGSAPPQRQQALLNAAWARLARLRDMDRRWIYLMTFLVLSIPFVTQLLHKRYNRFPEIVLAPALLAQAEKMYEYVEGIAATGAGQPRAVMVSFDWGPQTKAELEPVSRAILKHLFFRRIPVVLVTTYNLGAPMLKQVPHEVAGAMSDAGLEVKYGEHWVNLGFQPGGDDAIRALAADLRTAVAADAEEKQPLDKLPVMQGIQSADSFALMVEITGLVGAFDAWLQWFKKTRPARFGLGCTSISIPESYAFIDSGQLEGLFEGIAGAAAYERVLHEKLQIAPHQPAYEAMTAQIFGQGLILLLVALGNLAWLASRTRRKGAP